MVTRKSPNVSERLFDIAKAITEIAQDSREIEYVVTTEAALTLEELKQEFRKLQWVIGKVQQLVEEGREDMLMGWVEATSPSPVGEGNETLPF
jgi:hypothetical protein